MEPTDLSIETYVKTALESQNLKHLIVEITGSTGPGDGYGSHIKFATATVTKESGEVETLYLAVKCSKKNLMEIFKSVYDRELYFYNVILPEFTRFQVENKIKHIFNSVPKCYKTISDGTSENLVMENMRKNGYVLHDSKKPLNLEHVKLVMREYGKFHAISFALRHKRKADFKKLVNNFEDNMIQIFDVALNKSLHKSVEKVCNMLKNENYIEEYKTCYKILQQGPDNVLTELLTSVDTDCAILHGDSWNNNFLFKYENEDFTKPTKVAILDWQIAKLHSPVMDLSYFIYNTCSENELRHFDELLKTYYNSFSTFSMELGCDHEKLFPYSTLQRHWKKYSKFGLMMAVMFLHATTCDKESVPDFSNSKDGSDMGDAFVNIENNSPEYRKRLVGVIRHYIESTKH